LLGLHGEVEAGLGEVALDEVGTVLHPFEAGLDQRGQLIDPVFGQFARDLREDRRPGGLIRAGRHPGGHRRTHRHVELQQAAALRREAVAEALASVRAEGLEPSPEGLDMFEAIAEGRMTVQEARERTLARYRR
jgi:hypothetical protein